VSTPAEEFASRWPLETVPIEVGDIVLEDQIVVEFEKIGGVGRDTLTGRVLELWWGSDDAILFEDSAGYRWRVDEHGALIREHDEITIGEDAEIEAVREVIPDGGRVVRKRVPCDGDCDGQTEHVHLGKNDVRRDVWRCTRCDETRAGPILSRSDVAQPVATDGGGR